jgi:hypothetical protein
VFTDADFQGLVLEPVGRLIAQTNFSTQLRPVLERNKSHGTHTEGFFV